MKCGISLIQDIIMRNHIANIIEITLRKIQLKSHMKIQTMISNHCQSHE